MIFALPLVVAFQNKLAQVRETKKMDSHLDNTIETGKADISGQSIGISMSFCYGSMWTPMCSLFYVVHALEFYSQS